MRTRQQNVCRSSDGRHPSVFAAMTGHSRHRWGGLIYFAIGNVEITRRSIFSRLIDSDLSKKGASEEPASVLQGFLDLFGRG